MTEGVLVEILRRFAPQNDMLYSLPCVRGGGFDEVKDGGIVQPCFPLIPQSLRASSLFPFHGKQEPNWYVILSGAKNIFLLLVSILRRFAPQNDMLYSLPCVKGGGFDEVKDGGIVQPCFPLIPQSLRDSSLFRKRKQEPEWTMWASSTTENYKEIVGQ